jgi:hypothetical protein
MGNTMKSIRAALMPGLFLSFALLSGCDRSAEVETHPEPWSPDSLRTGRGEVWYQSKDGHNGAWTLSDSPALLRFSDSGMSICRQYREFTACTLILGRPFHPDSILRSGYTFHGRDSIQRVDSSRGLIGYIYFTTTFLPSNSAFPPAGWGEYRTPEATRDSIEKALRGKWSLRIKSAKGRKVSAEPNSAELGSMFITSDSIFLEADSAGVRLGYRGPVHLDETNRLRADPLSLGDFFLKDMERVQGIQSPGRWENEFEHDSLWISATYYGCCGARGADVVLGWELMLFLKVPEP